MADITPKDLSETLEGLNESIVDLSKLIGKLNFKNVIKSSNDLGKSINASISGVDSLVGTFIKFKDVSKQSIGNMQTFHEISQKIAKDSQLHTALQAGLENEMLDAERRETEAKIKMLGIENDIARSTQNRIKGEDDITKIVRIRNKLEADMNSIMNIEDDILAVEKDRIDLAGKLSDKYKEQTKNNLALGNSKRSLYKLQRDISAMETAGLKTTGDVFKHIKLNEKLTETLAEQMMMHSRAAEIKTEIGDINSQLTDNDKLKLSLLDRLANRDAERLKITRRMVEIEKIHARMMRDSIIDQKLLAGYFSHMKEENYKMLGPLGQQIASVQAFFKTANLIPPLFLVLSVLIEQGIDRFIKLDKAAEAFRRSTGLTVNQMTHLRKYAEATNLQFAAMGITIEAAYKASSALVDSFSMASLVTEKSVKNVALMSANLNVAESDAAQVLSTFQGLGGMSEKLAFNVMKVVAGMESKTGVPFSLVMKDIANASETTMSMLGANPTMLMKSAIAARTMGTDLNKITQIMRKMLDFQSSITDELELSALLGTSISFQKTRQLAYEGRIEDAARATLDTVKAAGDFDKMSVYQREALAKAAGMELKDLSKMMAVDKKRSDIMNGSDQAAKDRLIRQEAALKQLNEQNDLSKQSLANENETAIRQQKMQGLTTQYSNMLQAVLIELGSLLEPVIRFAVSILVPTMKIISKLIHGLFTPFHKLGVAMLGMGDAGQKFEAILEKVYPIVEKIGEGMAYTYYYLTTFSGLARLFGKDIDAVGIIFGKVTDYAVRLYNVIKGSATLGKIFNPIVSVFNFAMNGISRLFSLFKPLVSIFGTLAKGSSFLGMFARGFSMIAKVAGPLGLIINAIQVVVDLASQWIGIWSDDKMNLGDKLLKSFLAIPKALFNVLVAPFIDLGVWILRKFGFDIPDGMVEGIKSVGSEIAQWLLMPFAKVLEWLKETFLGNSPSVIGEMIVNGIQSISSILLTVLTSPFKLGFDVIQTVFTGVLDLVKKVALDMIPVLVQSISSIGGIIFNAIVTPFKAAFESVQSAFSYVVDSIKNVASELFGFIISPFKQAMEFVKNIPLFGKMFGGNDISVAVKPEVETTVPEVASVIEVKNMDLLREAILGLTGAILNSNSDTEKKPMEPSGTISTAAIEEKLDKLTNLLVGGAISVYLDGTQISRRMSGLS
jgi:hypothetical protein